MKKMKCLTEMGAAFFLCIIVMGCQEGKFGSLSSQPSADAVAILMPVEGGAVAGTVRFARTKTGLRVMAKVEGLTPGLHGFHIHTFGDCRSEDFSSAGGHFDPRNQPHGARDSEHRHVGDLGNIDADQAGTARVDFTDDIITLDGAESIIGRSVVVHEGADDGITQPDGNAGRRVACGVVGFAHR